MNTYKIWAEGYEVTGNSGHAYFHGTGEGQTFAEACAHLATRDGDFAEYFDPKHLTHWGCRLFPTLEEARKSFG